MCGHGSVNDNREASEAWLGRKRKGMVLSVHGDDHDDRGGDDLHVNDHDDGCLKSDDDHSCERDWYHVHGRDGSGLNDHGAHENVRDEHDQRR